MRILISNDDGILAEGIKVLSQQLSMVAEVVVVAPDRNKSGASNSLSLTRPLRVKQLDNGHYSVEGTPTDCVHLALTGFFEEPFDMVVSGINEGANLGDDILYSGTVAAAMEGRYLGLPALALSLVGDNLNHYETAAVIAKQLILRLSVHKLPLQTILNINVPNIPLSQIKGIQLTRLGTRHAAAPLIKHTDPRGGAIYWIGPAGPEADAGIGTDFHAVNTNHVSVTPLHLDLTHYQLFEPLSNWLNGFKHDL